MCDTQEGLKTTLAAHFPATKGRSPKNHPFRALFAALLPGTEFVVSYCWLCAAHLLLL